MKLIAIATALLGVGAIRPEEVLELQINAQSSKDFKNEMRIQSLISDAFKNENTPFEITVPKVNLKTDKEGMEKLG